MEWLAGFWASAWLLSWSRPRLSGRAGVADLVRRSVRWRVSVRWYLIALLPVPVGATLISLAIYGPGALAAPAGGWPRALAEVAAVFVLQLVLFQLAEEIGFTGFLQHHWQDRYHPMKLTLYVALLWAVWHIPDHFAEEGWGVEALILAPVIFAIEVVSLFFARAIFVWFYNRTGSSVLLVAIFHASFDASINHLSDDVAPGSNTARFLIFSAVIIVFALVVIIATKGQLGRRAAAPPCKATSLEITSLKAPLETLKSSLEPCARPACSAVSEHLE